MTARVVAVVCVLFGLLTLEEGGSVLFDVGGARHAAGHYVPFVLVVNFALGLPYVVAGVGIFARRAWAWPLAVAIAAITALTFAAFGVHVALGGAFETRTVIALTLRTAFWLAISLAVPRWRLAQ